MLVIWNEGGMMERITQETTIGDYSEWLSEMGFDVEQDENLLIVKNKAMTFVTQLLPSKNLIFRVSFIIQDNVDEFELLKMTNEMNGKALSGCFNVQDGEFSFIFSLVKPFGMGKDGFEIFVKYNLNLLGFMLIKSGIKEFIE